MRMALVLSLGILASPVTAPAAERAGWPFTFSQLRQPGDAAGARISQPQAYGSGAMYQTQSQAYRNGSMAPTQSQMIRGGSMPPMQSQAYRGRSIAPSQTQAYRGGSVGQTQPDPDQQEAVVNQRIGGVQQQMAREQQVLQSRLAEFNRMREAALQKQDQKQLNAIEQRERQTVEAYQQRIDRLVSGLSLESAAQGNPATGRALSAPQSTQPKPQQAPAKRRNWFLPFGR